MQVFSGKIEVGIEGIASANLFLSNQPNTEVKMTKKYYTLPLSFAPHPTDYKFQDLTGRIFSQLTVLGFAGKRKRTLMWFCQCDCGHIVAISGGRLRGGYTRSCGCLGKKNRFMHGGSKTTEYNSFNGARQRCQSTKHPHYKHYGGRGIEFRFDSFEDFLDEVGLKPTQSHSLDRIDNNGHYEKGNVRWATQTEQCRNKRTNHYIEFNGEIKTIAEWSSIFNDSRQTIRNRLARKNACVECAFSLPFGKRCVHRKGTIQPSLDLIEV